MRRTSGPIGLALVVMAGAATVGQDPAGAPGLPSIQVNDPSVNGLLALRQNVILMPAVQEELKITEAQHKEIDAIRTRFSERFAKVRQDEPSARKRQAATEVIRKETSEALDAVLEPGQRARVDQIQIQARGPNAFIVPPDPTSNLDFPDLPGRLKLTEDQAQRINTIVEASREDLRKAAAVSISLDTKAGAPAVEVIRILVESPEFRAAKQNARDAVRKACAAVVARIELILAEPQRAAYHEMLGLPFDLSKLAFPRDEAAFETQMIERALRPNRGAMVQRSDPDFDTKVARPAYTTEHPRILFDEAHNNFHTTDGRYKPFAELIGHDGYQVIPNKETLTRDVLAKANILISANALGRGSDQSTSAFTEAECDAVRDWVQAGGSLLLITDHAPFGAGSASLAKRFGVEMSMGYTSDPSNSEGGPTALVFTRKANLLGDHPITQGRDESERLSRIQTFTGQSLKGPDGSAAILKLADTAFDEGPNGKPVSAAGRVQGCAFAFGKGRVVVLGEAAELSAQLIGTKRFGMNVAGLDNRQMALNIMHWLSGLLEPRKKAG